MTNITINNTFPLDYVVPSNQVYYVEELCKPYIQSLGKAYIIVAIFNICYSFVWLWLKNRKNWIIFKFTLEEREFKFTVDNIRTMLDIIFFMLNFFVFGYWLVLKYTSWFTNLPFIGWFN